MKDNIDRMYTYSGNHITVDNGAVFVNGVNIYSPANSGRYTGEERAYFMAGKLARLYHNGQFNKVVRPIMVLPLLWPVKHCDDS